MKVPSNEGSDKKWIDTRQVQNTRNRIKYFRFNTNPIILLIKARLLRSMKSMIRPRSGIFILEHKNPWGPVINVSRFAG